MDFRYTTEEQAYRMEVRKFLEENLPEELIDAVEASSEEILAIEDAFMKKMADRGWIGLGFPKEYGGQGETLIPMNEYILLDELHHAGAGDPPLRYSYMVGTIGNTLLRHGSEELKKELLPKILNADVRLCLCYSEPEAGNDLGALQCKAVEDGDCFVLNGTKRFITRADVADYMWTAVRTGPHKHKGISIMMVETKLPGITISPIWMMNGTRTNHVYFDDVRVPKKYLIGEKDRGWSYLMEALARERFTIINFRRATRPFEKLVEWVRTARLGSHCPKDDPVVRQKLAHMQVRMEAGKMLQLIAAARAMDKDYVPILESAAVTMWRVLVSWDKADLAHDIMRSYAGLRADCEDAPLDGNWADQYAIAGHAWSGAGGADINRKTIAMLGLGLPKPW